ncbi:hypothetical protein QS432_13200 [Staphylococcus pseudintermedius]|nr:hypothetical protein QS432_13200 [Staphylococcus pseudintermedius]
MKEQWLKLKLQFFSDAGTEEAVSDENVETEPTQEVEELSESQMKLVNERVNEEMARRTKEMRQQIQDELTEQYIPFPQFLQRHCRAFSLCF